MTLTTVQEIENLSLRINQEICVRAPLEVTFAALLEQLGQGNELPDGTPMPMKIEPWPGGRWFRDLGDGNGHYWATVQSIRQPTLLELCGPLFMSQPVTNNLIYRLSYQGGETIIKFCHQSFGLILDEHRMGVATGWNYIHEKVRQRAEKK
jgi:hypothetical protein